LLTKAELIANCMDNVSGDFLKMDCKEIIDKYFGKLKVVFTAQSECRFLCDCSRKRLTRVLVSLGKEESEEMIKELGKVEFTCHFCGKLYEFYEEDVERIFSK
ncbi:MAG: Hsp33 family molecular chaperone HslO, partial [Clostridia bacterium]